MQAGEESSTKASGSLTNGELIFPSVVTGGKYKHNTVMSTDYFPKDDQDQRAWITQFLAQLATYSVTLGVTAGEVTALTTGGTAANAAIDNVVAKKNAYESALAGRDLTVRQLVVLLR